MTSTKRVKSELCKALNEVNQIFKNYGSAYHYRKLGEKSGVFMAKYEGAMLFHFSELDLPCDMSINQEHRGYNLFNFLKDSYDFYVDKDEGLIVANDCEATFPIKKDEEAIAACEERIKVLREAYDKDSCGYTTYFDGGKFGQIYIDGTLWTGEESAGVIKTTDFMEALSSLPASGFAFFYCVPETNELHLVSEKTSLPDDKVSFVLPSKFFKGVKQAKSDKTPLRITLSNAPKRDVVRIRFGNKVVDMSLLARGVFSSSN